MHQAMTATNNCSVTQAHIPAIVESKSLQSSVFPFFHSMAKPPRFKWVGCWHRTNVKHLLFLPSTHDTFPQKSNNRKKHTHTHACLSHALACPSPLLCPVPYSDLKPITAWHLSTLCSSSSVLLSAIIIGVIAIN